MADSWWIWVALVAVVVAVVVCLWYPRRRAGASRFSLAKRRFHAERERLEAKFIQLAAARGKLDAPRWADCTFADDVAYVRNRSTGELSALVAVTISTEQYGHSTHTTSDTVSNLQAGTAVFRFDRDHWATEGRAILNLSPTEAVDYYHNDLEFIAEDLAHR